jgi:hypothetical protein
MIEILRFRLAPDADEESFLAADAKVQSHFAYRQPGLLRRTTARDDNGGWVVIDLWQSNENADAAEALWGQDPVTSAYMTFIDATSVHTERYTELD